MLERSQDTTKTVESEEFTPETDEGVSSKDASEMESPSTEDSSPDSAELARRIPDRPAVGARKSKSLGDMLSLTKGCCTYHGFLFSSLFSGLGFP